MTTKAIAAVIAGFLGVIVLCALGGAALFGGGATGCSLPAPAGPALKAPAGGWPQIGAYNPDQVAMAATIVSVGAQMGVPVRGWVIATATAIQESSLSNPAGGDQDSIGLFQQRPSQGWGTPQQLHGPVYASQQFFAKLLTVPNWQDLPLTEAAQAVQRSATPDAIAKWESDATMLVNAIGGGVFWDSSAGPSAGPDTGFACGGDGGDGQPNGDGLPLPTDYTLPPSTPPAVATAIFWALSQLGTSYVFGGSCTDPHGLDPSTHCDCSALVQQAYRAAGITIPRTTTDQIYAGTAITDVSQIQAGDLLFIPGANGTPQHPGHVGMAIGDGLLIQAPHTGDVVKITKVSQWANQISIIRRVA